MSRYHIIIKDSDGQIVGQFDVNKDKRDHIADNLPSDVSLTERQIPDDMPRQESLDKLSDNNVVWDNRLRRL